MITHTDTLNGTRTWDEIYMNMCELVASKSKDPSSKFGAVIVGPDHEVRSTGFNGFPRGVVERQLEPDEVDALNERFNRTGLIEGITELSIPAEARWEHRAHKYKLVVHAETNAILNAAKVGIPTSGCTLYVNGFPCDRCAGAIVQAGITRLVFKDAGPGYMKRWAEFLPYSLLMLREGGVRVESFIL